MLRWSIEKAIQYQDTYLPDIHHASHIPQSCNVDIFTMIPNKGRVFAPVIVLRSKACHSQTPVTHKITAETIDDLEFVI